MIEALQSTCCICNFNSSRWKERNKHI